MSPHRNGPIGRRARYGAGAIQISEPHSGQRPVVLAVSITDVEHSAIVDEYSNMNPKDRQGVWVAENFCRLVSSGARVVGKNEPPAPDYTIEVRGEKVLLELAQYRERGARNDVIQCIRSVIAGCEDKFDRVWLGTNMLYGDQAALLETV